MKKLDLYKDPPWIDIPLRFGKARKVWCDGAQENHWVTCHNRVTPSKTE